MTGPEMTDWRKLMGLGRLAAARALGVAPATIKRYEDGLTQIPRSIALACTALAHKLPPW